MADTWGGYVSRLAELLDDESLSLDDLLSMLRIDRSDLQDPTVHFNDRTEFEGYKLRFRKEMADYYAPEIARMQKIFDDIIDGHKVPDQAAANEEADQMQDEIDCAEPGPTQEDYETYCIEQAVRGMRRDALRSGAIMPITEFVATMLSVNLINDGDFKSELAPVWVRALNRALESFYTNRTYEDGNVSDVPADRIVVGQETFTYMRDSLEDIREEIDKCQYWPWKIVEPVFVTDHAQINALITGVGAQ